jgi:hypothetical protein
MSDPIKMTPALSAALIKLFDTSAAYRAETDGGISGPAGANRWSPRSKEGKAFARRIQAAWQARDNPSRRLSFAGRLE